MEPMELMERQQDPRVAMLLALLERLMEAGQPLPDIGLMMPQEPQKPQRDAWGGRFMTPLYRPGDTSGGWMDLLNRENQRLGR